MNLSPLIAFGFSHVPMLGWLAAAAIPLVLYLLSRRHYHQTRWAAMQFLLAAARRQRFRLRVEPWLLVAARMGLVALVVLAAAGAYLSRGGPAALPALPVYRLLIVDTSYSMAYRQDGKSRLDEAKATATALVRRCGAGDAFSLVAAGNPARVVVGPPTFDGVQFQREIDQLTIEHTAASAADALATAVELIERAGDTPAGRFRREVYLLTDLDRNGWDGADRAEAARHARRLAELARLHLLDVGASGTENAAVVELRAARPSIQPGAVTGLRFTSRNFGPTARRGSLAELWIDARRVDERRIDLPAGAEASGEFSYRFDHAGQHIVEVRLAADGLELDDKRWLAVEVAPRTRVLCVAGRAAGSARHGAADYLAQALAASPRGAIQCDLAPENGLLDRELAAYQAIFLCDVAQFTQGEARALRGFVSQGGVLFVFMGQRVLAAQYNQLLVQAAEPALLPFALGAVVDTSQQPRSIDARGYRHPALAVFEGQPPARQLAAPVWRYIRPEGPTAPGADVVLALDNGDPLLVAARYQRGRVVVCNTSADASWNALPLTPGYVPLVHELLAWALAARGDRHNLLVGGRLEGDAPAGPVQVEVPGGAVEGALRANQHWSLEAARAGAYTATDSSGGTERFVANLETVESTLAKLDLDELRRRVWSGVPIESALEVGLPVAGASVPGARPLAQWLLAGSLGLALFELLLARRLGGQPS